MSNNKTSASFSVTDSMAIKGIAIILMVFHHCFFRADLTADYAIVFYPFSHDFVVRMALVCKICVPIFAFLSGYGLYISFRSGSENHPVRQWTLKRLLSTMSGFWFVYILVSGYSPKALSGHCFLLPGPVVSTRVSRKVKVPL